MCPGRAGHLPTPGGASFLLKSLFSISTHQNEPPFLKEPMLIKELPDPSWLERVLQAMETRPFATLALIQLVIALGFCIWAYRRFK